MSFKSNQKRECEGESFMYNAVVNRSHKRRNDYQQQKQHRWKVLWCRWERGGGRGVFGGLVKVFNSFRCRAQMHLASGFHFGCGFGLKRFDLWRSDIKIGNMLQQLVPEQSSSEPSPSRAPYQDIWLKNEPATMKNLCWPRHMMNA